MRQILKFEIELFDVRTKSSTKIVDDRDFISGIQIRKDIYLNNQAVITFNKSKSYKNSKIEEKIKLYNYVKMKFVTKNYENTNFVRLKGSKDLLYEHTYYFSGFVTNISKSYNMSDNPIANVSLTISDFAHLFKTTFYTKNLMFLDILNQAVPEFRLLNFNDVFNDSKGELLNNPFSPNQMGFLFFAFLYFKFMYQIIRNEDGSPKTDTSSELGSQTSIYKDFKIFMPFDLSLPGAKSHFATQAQTLILYKQFQGTAYELFKYLYPEPIFEFNVYENEKSVILIIRPTPFMSFDRGFSTNSSKSIRKTSARSFIPYEVELSKFENSEFDIDSFNLIESNDFGFERIKNIEAANSTVSQFIRLRVEDFVLSKIRDIGIERNVNLLDLIPSIDESNELQKLFYNIQDFDIKFVEKMNMNRSSQNVVNIIWTTPVTDTALLMRTGRSIVLNQMQEDLQNLSSATFSEYVYSQFFPNKEFNPVFLWNYRNQFPNEFVSGDINYFGIREFEVKWNFMTLYENIIGIILRSINKKVLKSIINSNIGQEWANDIFKFIQRDAQEADKKENKTPTKSSFAKKQKNLEKRSDNSWVIRNAYNKSLNLDSENVLTNEALNDIALENVVKILGFSMKEISDIKNLNRLTDLIKLAKEKSVFQFGAFTKFLNSVIARAYRENEHLYSMNISTVINTSILPGMIINSIAEDFKYNNPRFRGYVSSVIHMLDFNSASFMTSVSLSRAASNDSSVT